MKKYLILAILLAAPALVAQTPGALQFALWDSSAHQYIWLKLGPWLVIRDGAIDVLPAPAPPQPKVRIYDAALGYNATLGGWTLPADATNVVVWCNGLRYHAGADYTIAAGVLKPSGPNMPTDSLVTIDYDSQ